MIIKKFQRLLSLLLLVSVFFTQTMPALGQDVSIPPVSEVDTNEQPASPVTPEVEVTPLPEEDADLPSTESTESVTTPDSSNPQELPEALEESLPDGSESLEAEETTEQTGKKPDYATLMWEVSKLKENKAGKNESELSADFDKFITLEKERLEKLGVSKSKQKKYLDRLEEQKTELPTLKNSAGSNKSLGEVPAEEQEIAIPDKPARFEFTKDELEIKGFNLKLQGLVRDEKAAFRLIPSAEAYSENYAPVIEDLQTNDLDTEVSEEIKGLAEDLGRNPVLIYDWLANNVEYEPYWGAKKGASGCLIEKSCNDVDAASLAISLLRASQIPARYKKAVAVITIEDLKSLLGVKDTKAVYFLLAAGDVPVFTVDGEGSLDGVNLETADVSGIRKLALEWTYPEIFYEYDERGGNINNSEDFSEIDNTEALRLQLAQTPNKQWIPFEFVVRPYEHVEHEVVPTTANFNFESFWGNFFQYQGDLSPLEKYIADLLQATGKDINEEAFQSYRKSIPQSPDILSTTLPYLFAEGTDSSGTEYNLETWSELPEERRFFVEIKLKSATDQSSILTHKFWGSEINNQFVDLTYDGATETDRNVLESYGSFDGTPPSLIDVKPSLFLGDAFIAEGEDLTMGEPLVMEFSYGYDENIFYSDQKFSTSGNNEGIYLIFSKLAEGFGYDENDNENRQADILINGNSAIAREYIKQATAANDLLAKSLNIYVEPKYFRAVVTQNRNLNQQEGEPTTFQYKGITIDASAYINHSSRSANFTTNKRNFALASGLQSSYLEADTLTYLTGLEAISTVNGLQYAFIHSGEYTLQAITESNASVIDSLDLSANTKANMHQDVQAGKIIITPNKPVTKGNWSGIIYVSLKLSDGTGTYAIGEQSQQNGGFTATEFDLISMCPSGGNCYVEYAPQLEAGLFTDFIYQGIQLAPKIIEVGGNVINTIKSASGLNCIIPLGERGTAIDNSGLPANAPAYQRYMESYGRPCYVNNKQYGTAKHIVLVTPYAFKFYGDKVDLNGNLTNTYTYWVTRTNLYNRIEGQTASSSCVFDSAIATVKCWNPVTQSDTYYSPKNPLTVGNNWTDNGKAYTVSGKIFWKLKEKFYKSDPIPTELCPPSGCSTPPPALRDKSILSYFGFPITAVKTATESQYGTRGYYQEFAGGAVYVETEFFDEAVYVPGFIYTKYIAEGGTGGAWGFPIYDPAGNIDAATTVQDFENGTRVTDKENLPSTNRITTELTEFRLDILQLLSPAYRDDLLEGFQDAMAEYGIVGAIIDFTAGLAADEVMEAVIKQAKKSFIRKYGAKILVKAALKFGVRLIPYAGVAATIVMAGYSAVQVARINGPLIAACRADVNSIDPVMGYNGTGSSPAYYCGKLIFNGAFFALGFSTNFAINRFAVGSKLAQKVKRAFYKELETDVEIANFTKAIGGNSLDDRNNRTTFLEKTESFTASEKKELANDPPRLNHLAKNSRKIEKFIAGDIRQLLTNKLGHITGIEFKLKGGKYEFTGVHSKLALDRAGPGNARIEITTPRNSAGVYEAKVYAKGPDGKEVPKANNKGKSTFFPDDWDEARILEEVHHAVENNKGNVPGSDKPDHLYGFSKDGKVKIEFYYNEATKTIDSFFPSLTGY